MQNRYVGDLGDFGKYGLLRWICWPGKAEEDRTLTPSLRWPTVAKEREIGASYEGSTIPLWPNERLNLNQSLTIGVVWYLVPDETHNGDGNHVQYLDPSAHNQERYRQCDPTLYDTLREIVRSEKRNVASIRDCQVLPLGTRFYEAVLTFDYPDGQGPVSQKHRIARRRTWLYDALKFTSDCDVVFVDPDNGFEVKVSPYQQRGPKYVFFEELLPLCREEPKSGRLPSHREAGFCLGPNSGPVGTD